MLLLGLDFLEAQLRQPGFSAKAVLNERGVIFFAVHREHRDQKTEGISYADDYAGNALAAMLAPGRIEIRFHRAFNDARVAALVRDLLADPRLAGLRAWVVTYQGRTLHLNT